MSDLLKHLHVIAARLKRFPGIEGSPGSALVNELLGGDDHTLNRVGGPILRKLDTEYGEWKSLASELIHVAMRCCVRGVRGFSVAEHRGENRSDLLDGVEEQVRAIITAADALNAAMAGRAAAELKLQEQADRHAAAIEWARGAAELELKKQAESHAAAVEAPEKEIAILTETIPTARPSPTNCSAPGSDDDKLRIAEERLKTASDKLKIAEKRLKTASDDYGKLERENVWLRKQVYGNG